MGRQAWGAEISGGLNGWGWGGLGGQVPEAGELVRDGAPVALQGAEAIRHPVPARRRAGEQRSEDRVHLQQQPPWGPTHPHCLSLLNLAQRHS